MHGFLVAIGVLIIFMIAVHILFRIVKVTLSVLIGGGLLIFTVYAFQQYLGIDLIAAITGMH